jgi:methyltransferase (TIGR00027 family)
MIETTEYKKIPATVLHRVMGKTDINEVKSGIAEAEAIIDKVIHEYGRFNLILDPRGHDFADLAAHKMWKMWLMQDVLGKGNTNYIANIVTDSTIRREEWELMNTEKTKFFFDFDEGSNWLQKMVDIEGNNTGLMRKGPSQTAEYAAAGRAIESIKPEDERICYDPYAIHFIGKEFLRYFELLSRNPESAKAIMGQFERLYPGVYNSTVARVRYFDDFVRTSAENGLEQLVILGSGYDTRAYRIEKLIENVKVYEVDHPDTQSVKMEKIKEIFGSLPDHVAYVPVDFGTEYLGQRLIEQGYNRSQKTLFIMEGLTLYIPPKAVDDILSFIVKNSAKGSAVIFDYFPESLVNGTCALEVGKNLRNFVEQYKESFQFGIKEGTVETFLAQRGFSQIKNVTSEDFKRAYFHGKNENMEVCSLLSVVHAVTK